jgi:hypothetical protein
VSDLSPDEFAASVLHGLGVRQTPGAMKALKGWIAAEGGHWNNNARFNPLNTTQPMPGAGNTGSQGNIKVYRNWRQGIDATVKTLENGRYSGIISALGRGDADAVASAIGASPWGTSADLVRKTIGGATGGTAQPLSGGTSSQSVTTHAPMEVPNWQSASEAADPVNLAMDFLHHKMDVISFVKAVQAANAAEPWNASSMAPTEGDTTTTYSSGGGVDSPSPSSSDLPTGTADFEGHTVAAWIAPALAYAREKGWKGQVNSGFRSLADQTRIYNSGVRPAAKPGPSNH